MIPRRVAVVGAGPAGCVAAYLLQKQGHHVMLFEKGATVGGRTRSFRKDGHVLDTGAAFITSFYPRVFQLLEELDLSDHVLELHRVTGLYTPEKTALLNVSSALSFIRFPFLGILDKLRMGLWTAGLTLKRRSFDLADPASLRNVDGQTVGDYARSRLNERIYDTLIRPGIEPFWYFSCEDISEGLMLSLTAWAAGAKFYAFTQGIDQLCRRLSSAVDLRCQHRIVAIQPRGDAVELVAQHQKEEKFEVDQVILATTATIASTLCSSLPKAWVSPEQQAFLSSQKYVSNIHATFQIPKLETDPGVTSILPCGPGKQEFAALSFHHRKAAGMEKHLVSLYLSGHESLRLLEKEEGVVQDHCWGLMRKIYPDLPLEGEPFHLIRRKEAIPIHAVGRYRMAADFQQIQQSSQSPISFCGDYLATATIEGAIASGMAAASKKIIAREK